MMRGDSYVSEMERAKARSLRVTIAELRRNPDLKHAYQLGPTESAMLLGSGCLLVIDLDDSTVPPKLVRPNGAVEPWPTDEEVRYANTD